MLIKGITAVSLIFAVVFFWLQSLLCGWPHWCSRLHLQCVPHLPLPSFGSAAAEWIWISPRKKTAPSTAP